ncbi:MAG: hypothetical protein ACXAE3_02220 [Candidatus Kariarchaeaceae archaeon]|jgi:hypothetical protein
MRRQDVPKKLRVYTRYLFFVINLVLLLLLIDFAIIGAVLASNSPDELIPNAKWELATESSVILFDLEINLPPSGIFKKSAFINLRITIESQRIEDSFVVNLGESLERHYEVPVSSAFISFIRSGYSVFYSVSLILTPLFLNMPVIGATRLFEYDGLIR